MNALLFKRNYLDSGDTLIADYLCNNCKSKGKDLNVN